MQPLSIFESIKIPTIMFIIIVFVAFLILLAGAAFIFWIYHTGSSMKPFFWGRISSWFDKSYSIFQIITLMDTVLHEEATYDDKKGYERKIETKQVKEPLSKKRKYIITTILILMFVNIFIFIKYDISTNHPILSTLILFILAITSLYVYFRRPTKKVPIDIERNQTPIIPTSSYSINGVDTVLLWDIHPKLPNYIKIGLETLINKDIEILDDNSKFNTKKITTLKLFEELCEQKPNDLLFDKYTNNDFLKMYLAYKNKFEVNVKIPTVFNFISKNFDENYSESIQIKEYNSAYKTKTDSSLAKWGYIIVGIFVLGITFKLIWVTIH